MTNFQSTKAPDGGWGWVVTLSAFLVSFILDGFATACGKIEELLKMEYSSSQNPDTEYTVPDKLISFTVGLIPAIYLCVGPISSLLTNRYGARPPIIAGGILGTFSFSLLYFFRAVFGWHHFAWVFLLLGVGGGVSFGLCYTAALLELALWFDNKRGLTQGIATAGSGIGTMLILQILQIKEDDTWYSVLFLYTLVIAQLVVCGAVYFPITALSRAPPPPQLETVAEEPIRFGGNIPQKIFDDKKRQRRDTTNSMDGGVITASNKVLTGEEASAMIDNDQLKLQNKRLLMLSRERPAGHITTSEGQLLVKPLPPVKEPRKSIGNSTATNSSSDHDSEGVDECVMPLTRVRKESLSLHSHYRQPRSMADITTSRRSLRVPLGDTTQTQTKLKELNPVTRGTGLVYRADVFYSGSIQNMPAYPSEPTTHSKNAFRQSVLDVQPGNHNTCVEICDPHVFRNLKFCLIAATSFTGMLGFYVPYLALNDLEELLDSKNTKELIANNPNMTAVAKPDLEGYHSSVHEDGHMLALGLANVIGRMFFGMLADVLKSKSSRNWLVSISIYAIPTFFSSLVQFCAVPLFLWAPFGWNTFGSYLYCILTGALLAPYICLRLVVITDVTRDIRYAKRGFGFNLMLQGIATAISFPIKTWLGHSSEGPASIDRAMYYCGSAILLTALLCLPLFYLCHQDDLTLAAAKKEEEQIELTKSNGHY